MSFYFSLRPNIQFEEVLANNPLVFTRRRRAEGREERKEEGNSEDSEEDDDDDGDDVSCPQENEYLQECLDVVQQEFMIFNRER